MRFLKLFLIVFLCNFLFARSDKLSNITLPQSSFLNIYLETCDENCMQNLIDKKLILSFLSIYDSDFSNKYIEETYFIYGQALSIFPAEKIEQKHDGRTRRLACHAWENWGGGCSGWRKRQNGGVEVDFFGPGGDVGFVDVEAVCVFEFEVFVAGGVEGGWGG